jgi:DNA transposition AAA+ family ATPase
MNIKKPERTDIFAPTSISKRIHETIDFAVRASRTAVIIGLAGIGKSAALADYCSSNRNAFTFELVQTKKTLERLAELVGATFDIYTSREFTSDIYDVLMDRLTDEAQLG